MNRALVTGGAGFVGQAVVRALLARGERVVAFQRRDAEALRQAGAEVRRGDLTRYEDVVRACQDVDIVYHVAARTGFAGPLHAFDAVNVLGTDHVLRACGSLGIRRLVYCSSPSVTLDGRDHVRADESVPYATRFLAHYPRTKAEAERRVLAANGQVGPAGEVLHTVALRPHLIFGPGDEHLMPRLIRRARVRRLRIIGNGTNEVDWTFVDNVAHAHLCAGDALAEASPAAAGKPYFITNDEPVRAWTFFNEVLARLELPAVTRSVPLGVARRIGWGLDLLWQALRLPGEPPLTEFAAVQVATTHTYSIEAAKRDLGYTPQVPLAEALDRTIPWLRRELDAGRFGSTSSRADPPH